MVGREEREDGLTNFAIFLDGLRDKQNLVPDEESMGANNTRYYIPGTTIPAFYCRQSSPTTKLTLVVSWWSRSSDISPSNLEFKE